MDVLLPAVRSKLVGDAELSSLVSRVDLGRNPDFDQIQKLTGPWVMIRGAGEPTETGLHGAATNPQVEVKVWGYGAGMIKACWQAARRIDHLFLTGFSSAGGPIMQPQQLTGFQEVDQPDPLVVHLSNTYTMRRWDARRVTEITTP